MAVLGLSHFSSDTAPPVDSSRTECLHRALTDRVGPLGWVLEGVLHSIVAGGLDAATRLWGGEAVELLWERELLESPDGDRDHHLAGLRADAFAWASATRTTTGGADDRSPDLLRMSGPRTLAQPVRLVDNRELLTLTR
jgi:hypothetical protein